jgi:two-component system NtrC family sensor kinase
MMRLTARLVLLTMLAMTLLTGAYGFLVVHREDRQLKQSMRDGAWYLGQTLERQVLVVWNQQGHAGVMELARQTSDKSGRLGVRWVHPDFPGGVPSVVMAAEMPVAATDEVISLVHRDQRGIAFLRTYYPIQVTPQALGYLEFSESLEDVEQYTRQTIYQTIALLGAMLACGGFVTLVAVKLLGRPLEQLIEKTERIGAGDFSGPLELKGYSELSQLAEALNRMCLQLADSQTRIQEESSARLATVEQLRHADRLKTVGRLASGLAHELGTPLNVVSGRAELIASGSLPADDVAASARAIKKEADRMAAIIRQLMDFARRGAPRRGTTDLQVIARQAVDLLGPLAHKRNVTLQVEGGGRPLPVHVDSGQIQQVLTNLIDNAMQALPQGGPVTLELGEATRCSPEATDDQPANYCWIAVRDAGQGIEPADLEHIFEPFFTTKNVGEGTGLGLSVSFGIVQDHDGWIDVTSTPGQGSRFTVYLPRDTSDARR